MNQTEKSRRDRGFTSADVPALAKRLEDHLRPSHRLSLVPHLHSTAEDHSAKDLPKTARPGGGTTNTENRTQGKKA